jgi:hypothetical protein
MHLQQPPQPLSLVCNLVGVFGEDRIKNQCRSSDGVAQRTRSITVDTLRASKHRLDLSQSESLSTFAEV